MTIFERAADLCDVDVGDLLNHCRYPEVVEARNAVYFVLHRTGRNPWSYSRIARYMGRDHTGIRHGVLMAEQRAASDARYKQLIEQLTKEQ